MTKIIDPNTGRAMDISNHPSLDLSKVTVEDLLKMQESTGGKGTFFRNMNDIITILVFEIKRTKSKLAELETKNQGLERRVTELLTELINAQQS